MVRIDYHQLGALRICSMRLRPKAFACEIEKWEPADGSGDEPFSWSKMGHYVNVLFPE